MQSIVIDKNIWKQSVSISDRHDEAGYSPNKKGHNFEYSQGGLLLPQPAPTSITGGVVTDGIIAMTGDPSFLGNDAYALDEDGNFYTIDAGVTTLRQTDAVKTYNWGSSDMRVFMGELFATSTTDIAKLTGSDLSTIDHDWWTTTKGRTALSSTYRHILEVVEDTMYISDENMLHTWDGTTATYNAFALPDMYNITSMIKATDGRTLMLFASETVDFSHSRRNAAKCFLIDTVNLEIIREIDIDAQIEGAINVGGVIYLTSGYNLGYWNGDGFSFLRKLTTSSHTYKHAMTKKENTLLVRDGNAVLAYGNLGEGNVFYYPYQHQTATNELNVIFYSGDNELLTSADTSAQRLNLIDFDTFADQASWESNFYSFAGKVWIRRIEVETETLASGSSMTFSYVDKNNTASTIMTMTYASDGAVSEKKKFCNIYTDLAKFRVAFAAGNTKGIIKIKIFYEDGE